MLAAARDHLLEVGLEGFSLREVARRCDLAPSALYNHFDSREELINRLAMEAIQVLGGYLEPVSRELPAARRLSALADAYLLFASEQPAAYRLVFDMLVSPSRAWDEFAHVAYPFTLIVEAVQAGLDESSLVDRDAVGAPGVAYGLWSMMHGAVMLSAHHLANVTDDMAPLRRAAVTAYLKGLAL